MIKRTTAIVFMFVLSTYIFGEVELGLSYTPGSLLKNEESEAMEEFYDVESGVFGDSIIGFHAGYSFWWLFYVSVDSLMVPPWWVYQLTSYTGTDGTTYDGINAPGFVNFFDIGIRPKIGPVYLLATVGVNALYIHSEYDTREEDATVGFNLRLGLGVKFDNFSFTLTGTSVYSDYDSMASTIENLIEAEDPDATTDFLESLIPSIGVVLHL